MTSSDIHLPSNRDSCFFLQLQCFVYLFSTLVSFLLCDLIMEPIFVVQELITFTVFLLNLLCNWLFWGKCLSERSRNRFAIFLDTAWLNGGLNHMMFLYLLHFLLFLCIRLYLKSTLLYHILFLMHEKSLHLNNFYIIRRW